MKFSTKIFSILIVLAVIIVIAGAWFFGIRNGNGKNLKSYKIGVIAPLSGESAALGDSIKKGIELAVQQYGKGNIEVVFQDTKCDPGEAVSGINELITIHKVDAVIGEACSGATLAAAPVVERHKVPLISPASTSPEITRAGGFVFRTIPSDALQGVFAAKMVFNDHRNKLGILYSDEPYGIGLIEIFTRAYHDLGGEIVGTELFEATSIEAASSAVKRLLAKGVDSIFMVSNGPETMAEVIKLLDKTPDAPPLYGAEGIYFAALTEGVGDAAEGLRVSLVSLGSNEFKESYYDLHGIEPGVFAAQSYDAFNALQKAFDHSDKTNLSLEKALANIDFQGATGKIVFDSNGDVAGNYDIVEFRDGKFQEL